MNLKNRIYCKLTETFCHVGLIVRRTKKNLTPDFVNLLCDTQSLEMFVKITMEVASIVSRSEAKDGFILKKMKLRKLC